jgi:hypothetical protein
MFIWLWPKDTTPEYDYLNVPVWCHEEDGFLFVRRAMPRMGDMAVDVIEGGKASELCPQAICVTERMDHFD